MNYLGWEQHKKHKIFRFNDWINGTDIRAHPANKELLCTAPPPTDYDINIHKFVLLHNSLPGKIIQNTV